MSNHTIWNERYRTDSLDDFIAKDDFKNKLKEFIEKNDIPHLMFYGHTGSGKTTLAKLLVKNIDCDHLFLNASDENGIDVIRDKVKTFASTATFKPLKIIILDEADFLTINAQSVLRNIIETYSKTTRFIFTCNFIERMISPLVSRCESYSLEPPSMSNVGVYMTNILDKENIEYDKKEVAHVIMAHYPDIRRIINSLQSQSSTGILKLSAKLTSNYKDKMYNLLSSRELKTEKWKGIRQIIADNDIKDFQDIYSFLYNKYFDRPEIVVILADYQYKQTFVIDREICFMACIQKIMEKL